MKYEGKPCAICGNTTRYIRNDGCTDCSIRRARLWKQKNPERTKELSRQSSKRAREGTQRKKLTPVEVRVLNKEYFRRYWLRNRDKINAIRREKRRKKDG